MSERKVFIRDNGGAAPFRVVVKPHPGVGQLAGNVFGLQSKAEAIATAAALAESWSCPIVDETSA